MKKTAILLLGLLLLLPTAIGAKSKSKADPVVMKLGNTEVRLSEFEYLYNKNNAQQQADLSLSDYIDMFVNYKLKVLAARDAGLDTLEEYRADMARYSAELAAPYFVDRAMADSLTAVAYDHLGKVVTVTHLFLPRSPQTVPDARQRALADSIRVAVMAGASFDSLVMRHSVDPLLAENHGRMRLTHGTSPYDFEDVAYGTRKGELSPVFETIFGFHLLRVDAVDPNPGEIKTRHILLSTRGKSDPEILSQKQTIDSLYALLQQGADFATLASKHTEDPSGIGKGGELPWVGPCRLVPAFESTAYSLADGTFSQPVLTPFGYHIIYREASRPIPSVEALKDQLEESMAQDNRGKMLRERALNKFASDRRMHINGKAVKAARKIYERYGKLSDSCAREIASLPLSAFTLDGKKYSFDGIAECLMPGDENRDPSAAFDNAFERLRNDKVAQLFTATLADRQPEYRNLLNEYSDGMLLYEISNRMIWDRANKDVDGLETYFSGHRSDFAWTAPHYVGYLISATTDSVANLAVELIGTLPSDIDDNTLATELRKKTGKEAKIDRVNAAQGEFPIIDHAAFGGPIPATDNRWKSFRAIRGSILDQPQCAMHVKGQVSVAYQHYLEDQWIEQLRQTYAIDVDKPTIERSLTTAN